MQQYLLSIYQPDGEAPPPEKLDKVMQNVNALLAEVKAAGAWVFNGGLHPPSTATVVQVQDGSLLTTDGPFAESKEHIGGFLVVRAADLDAALAWAGKLAAALTLPGPDAPRSGLPIEVRPFRSDH